MQVLGQYVESGDVILFPRKNRVSKAYWAEVVRSDGSRAYDKDGNHVQLPYDDHVTVLSAVPK